MLDETRQRLYDWARWVRSGGISNGFAQVKLGPGAGGDVPDEEALQVDRAVARLKARDQELGRVLVNYYVRGWDFSQVGFEMRVSREKARTLLRSAEAWVDAVLSLATEAAS